MRARALSILPPRPAPVAGPGTGAAITMAAALASAALAWWLLGGAALLLPVAALLAGGGAAAAAMLALGGGRVESARAPADWGLLHSAFADSVDGVAITDRDGRLACANPAYRRLFGDDAPLPGDLRIEQRGTQLAEAMRAARRDGAATIDDASFEGHRMVIRLRRAGQHGDHLVWRFHRPAPQSLVEGALKACTGPTGANFGAAGLMYVVVDGTGHLLGANRVFVERAIGAAETDVAGLPLVDLILVGEDGTLRLSREGEEGGSVRIVPVALDDGSASADDADREGADGMAGPTAYFILDEDPDAMSATAARGAATLQLHELLAMLPLGLALTERDGRFLFLNSAFGRAAGLAADEQPIYPSDLVVEEDKGAVADAVRRFAGGRALPGDLAIRLKHKPDEPVALTIANAKGLGDAAVLLSLKDNSEESKLKRQVAQATKMQAVGQLAGGVAHDFNNILTAIIGHCDLMAMRHTPGDIDHDDIQQIRNNSNRAAGLTRQLLAFSRQQTLRPQVLRLPDVISEVSNLLRRLLGETVRLEVRHGRNLGLVRADPGQLEQVIVNLAVNARDAMAGGGKLTIETYAVSAADVRRMRSDIMPIIDFTAFKISDTGCGIPAENLAKIFEPFFTTKEVGRGTGLGLSTVYGIVKQTDGFIFADSEMGHGTSFTIYLPVHHAAPAPAAPMPVRAEAAPELWGTGTVLLVEDEAMVRAVAERALTRQGYAVLTAGNGEEALELLDGGAAIDLLMSDVVMPVMDGPTLVRRARQRFPDLKVLFMSGYAEEQLRNSIDVDHVAFLPKPFSVQQLGGAVRDALASATVGPAADAGG